jgi:hypothetical protein
LSRPPSGARSLLDGLTLLKCPVCSAPAIHFSPEISLDKGCIKIYIKDGVLGWNIHVMYAYLVPEAIDA